MTKLTGFVAYSAQPYDVTVIINQAVEELNRYGGLSLTPWEENDISGKPISTPIFQNIEKSDVLVADITKLNFNVTYEIGYAIGRGKRVFLIRSEEYEIERDLTNRIGIFDTLGYTEYRGSRDLVRHLQTLESTSPFPVQRTSNKSAPVYILETPIHGSIMTHVIARVKKARLQYRSFTPAEDARLSAIDAVEHVASSFGAIVPLLSEDMQGFAVHHIRAAFVAGLSHGVHIPTLILQSQKGPVPLDVRDFVKTYAHPSDIDAHIHKFSLDIYERIQQQDDFEMPEGNFLAKMTMGDPMAENEFQSLGSYYLQTDEFGRTLRGETNLVVGRKGTGKTALFSQVRNRKRKVRQNIVVNLKPEGYQLIKLKEELLDYLSEGAKAHLITAFWEYLLYLEVCYKVLEKDEEVHLRDTSLYEEYQAMSEIYTTSPNIAEGDFSERLLTLSEGLTQDYGARYGGETERRLTSDEVTALMHSSNLRDIQAALSRYLKHKQEVWILFDNLDKGWSTHGLAKGDVVILRCLIDAARKIQRQMRRDGHDFYVIVFVRNDVYQLLMDESSDFGKETRASLDWSDPELLRELLRMRLVHNIDDDPAFEQIWSRVCISHYDGEETSQYLIERSLMRPRNLLKLFAACRGFAVNLKHERIEKEDIEKGLKAYSNDLVVDADHELTDIEPDAKNLIYQFIGEASEFTTDDLDVLLEINGIPEAKRESIVEFLLYYAFLGLRYLNQDVVYVYDAGYDMQILRTRMQKNRDSIRFVLNPAFWPALGIQPAAQHAL